MEFVIKSGALKEVLGIVQGVVERKSTIPVLSNILIESLGENSIRIVGTDLDVTIRCDVEAEIRSAGAMCVQSKRLFDLSRQINSPDVKFKKEDNEWVSITAGRGRFRLAGVSRDQFPEVPMLKSAPLKLPAEVFNKFIQHTSFAITSEQARFTLSGAKFILANGSAKMVTTDGHRLAYIERPVTAAGDGAVDVLIPKKALTELGRILRDPDEEVAFGEDQNNLYFQVGGYLLSTRKLTGNFPNYEMVMPKDNDKTVVVELDDIRGSLRRVALLADERNRSVRMTVRDGEVELSSQSSDEGEGVETLPAEYKGEEISFGFNHGYLLDFLNVAAAASGASGEAGPASSDSAADDTSTAASSKETDGDKVRVKDSAAPTKIEISFKDPTSQAQMRVAGDSQYDHRYIVMPLRI